MSRPAVALIVISLGVYALPVLFPSDPMRTDPANQMQPPNTVHPLGTDLLGRDILSRTLYGGQRTLLAAALATATAVIPGAILGVITGWSRRWVDRTALAVMNAFIAFPGLLMALVIVTLLGRGIPSIVLAVGLSQVVPCTLIIRAAVLSVRAATYIEAAVAAGASGRHITWHHVVPNILPTLAAYTGILFAYSILNGAALSFLELGGEPGTPEWGAMLAEGRPLWRTAPWVGLAPGLAITLTVMSVNRLIDHLSHQRR